jgi:predicted metalloprotease
MRWTPGGRSRDLEDRRFEGRSRLGRRGVPIGLGGLLLVFLLSVFTGQDFLSLVGGLDQVMVPADTGLSGDAAVATSPEEERLVEFVSFVLDDNQKTWSELLPGQYQNATLVLFRDAVESACGFAQSATGPFYCPGDRKVYIDLSFYDELRSNFGAPGEFAQAYVLAHEIGHHVQNLLGIERQVRQLQQSRPGQGNDLSVRMELQADCLAGVWGSSTARRDLLEAGDVEAGLNAAAAIGDDRIQRMSAGRVHPESFTHGSSEQRVEWLRRGLQSGDPDACNTFGS